jgi:hypothetical protein
MKVFSNELAADGGINQDAVSKLLAKDASNPWPTFFREVFQNSNDARLSSQQTFTFQVETKKIGESAAKKILEAHLDNAVPLSALSVNLPSLKHSDSCLMVSDFGTTGLGGTTDPRTADENSKFSNFFFKFGRESDQTHDGGAFGFGRNVLFSASLASTIFVYTRFVDGDQVRSRFMGMTANSHFKHDNKNFTGRHWWCDGKDATGAYKPFQNGDADEIAAAFGFPVFPVGETGTSVMVLMPGDDPDLLVAKLQLSALIHAWPHFLDEPNRKRANFVFSSFGELLSPLSPLDTDSPLRPFAMTFLDLVSDLEKSPQITCSSIHPMLQEKYSDGVDLTRAMGAILSASFPVTSSTKISDQLIEAGLPSISSIAVMRSPRIVVRYLSIGESNAQVRNFGCFIAHLEWDPVFREAENLTHDEWEPSRLNLPKGAANPIRQTLDKIPELYISESRKLAGLGSGNAAIGDEIGELLKSPVIGGPVGDPEPELGGGGGGGGGGGRGQRIILRSKLLEGEEGNRVSVTYAFEMLGLDAITESEISADPFVMTPAGREVEAPKGVRPPETTLIKIDEVGTSPRYLRIKINFDSGTQIGLIPSIKSEPVAHE